MLQSSVGFGFNLLAVPILTLLFVPEITVPAMVLTYIPVGIALTIYYRRDIVPRRLLVLVIGAMPGLFIGTFLLAKVDGFHLKRIIGAVTILCTLLLLARFKVRLRREKPWILLAGGISGILGGCTAMSGPPVLLLGLNQRWDSATFRATLIAYFAALSVLMTIILTCQGQLEPQCWKLAAAALPGLVAGMFAGIWLAHHISGAQYRRMAIGVLFAAGAIPLIFG